MPELTEPELNRRERWTRELLMLLPSEYGDPADRSEEKVTIVRSILAKQYVEHTNLGVVWKTALMLLVYDWLFTLSSQVYGLTLGALGSLALALPNLYTPEILAEDTFDKTDTVMAEIESKAELSVRTNIGVAGLAVGFVWQILAISGPIPGELITQNHLKGVIPTWLGFIIILTLGFLILGSGVSNIRGRT
ncbi:hypothetical protein HUG10_01825 [Halorarum halophilum]|uniref:Uncharacterized protein n=1 Tax=Halorarum halophilum TaxID=2743090 RepID=A0A7D5KK42_9EURY|nr:hypothetical protein [Halobaculum halophilum]QLG26355.1 hypothetical protein HUG10_01825 [Halobaculum halophilum]